MKKSKFLKKSLAMLLALMLVVAMIPLSAAAQTQPALNYLYVNDFTVANNGGTFEVDAHYESTGVDLSYAAGALNYGTKAGSLGKMYCNT